jgi:uncharacterized membrane protein
LSAAPPTAAARAALHVALAVLVATLFAWHLSRLQPSGAALAILVTAGPWLLLWPALWRRGRRAHVLAAILAAPTIAYALMESLANPGARAFAGTALLAAFAVFVAAGAWLRFTRTAPVPGR